MSKRQQDNRRGFASMTPEKRKAIASLGGKAAHRKGTAHRWTSEEARLAGHVGGTVSRGGRGKIEGGMTLLRRFELPGMRVEIRSEDGAYSLYVNGERQIYRESFSVVDGVATALNPQYSPAVAGELCEIANSIRRRSRVESSDG